jgi:hypothetical protein
VPHHDLEFELRGVGLSFAWQLSVPFSCFSVYFIGSSVFPVLSNCVDQPRNQCRRALEDVSHKKSSLARSVGVRCLSRPTLTTFLLLLNTEYAESPNFWIHFREPFLIVFYSSSISSFGSNSFGILDITEWRLRVTMWPSTSSASSFLPKFLRIASLSFQA